MNEFDCLTYTEQIDLLYKDGVYIGKRKQNKNSVVLYQLHRFYVEIFYSKYRRYIAEMRSSASTDVLQPYLQQIDVEELIRCVS